MFKVFSTVNAISLFSVGVSANFVESIMSFSGRHLQEEETDADSFDELDSVLDSFGYEGEELHTLTEEELDAWFRDQMDYMQEDYARDPDQKQRPKRWSERSRSDGWDYDEVREEFADFFDKKDISEFTAEDWDSLELEFDRVQGMLDKAEKSGKVKKEKYMKGKDQNDPGWWESESMKKRGKSGKSGKPGQSRRKHEQMYESALYEAGQSQGRYECKRTKRGIRCKDDDEDEERIGLVVITAAISVLLTSAVFCLVLCCKKRRQRTALANGTNESELANGSPGQQQQQHQQVPRDSMISVQAPGTQLKVNDDPINEMV